MPQQTEIKAIFGVPANLIYASMTDQRQVCQWTRNLAESDPRPDGALSMFDGNITGIYQEVQVDKLIKMKWKFKEWQDYADCVVEFVSFNDSCEVNVKFTNIPDRDSFSNNVQVDSIQRGWRENIFKMIYQIFGYPLRDE